MKLDGVLGWAYEIYHGEGEKLIAVPLDVQKEIFETQGRAELAAVGQISLLNGGK